MVNKIAVNFISPRLACEETNAPPVFVHRDHADRLDKLDALYYDGFLTPEGYDMSLVEIAYGLHTNNCIDNASIQNCLCRNDRNELL